MGGMLSAQGRALDVGCGNGATLTAMSTLLNGWSFSGHELGDDALPRLARIPRFEKLYTGPLNAIDGHFDLVTMIHSLEHFPSPAKELTDLLPIVGSGNLFIEVCNIEENPFDILVADHLMHFSPTTLARLLHRCGFAPVLTATDWVPKEISALFHADVRSGLQTQPAIDCAPNFVEEVFRRISGYVAWLQEMTHSVSEHARRSALGVFGTSIAATWIASQLGSRIEFFIDEDESRIGKMHMGRPVLHPRDVPPHATVYFALTPRIATMISDRLSAYHWNRVLPPESGVECCLGRVIN